MELKIFEAQIDAALDSDLEVSYIGLVDRPAIERNFQAFKEHPQKFAINEELHVISGAAMVAGLPMYRNDYRLGEYFVYFSKETIQEIVEKFSAKGLMQKFNLFHDDSQQVSDVTIFNSFVTNKTLGIHPPAGFEDLAEGSWFISVKVNNPAVWEKVKSGMIKGFSVEGIFAYLPTKQTKITEEQAMERIMQILNETLS
jgi:hypothetical protein